MMDEKKVRKAIERIKQDIHVLEERKEYDEYGQQTLDIAIEHYNTAIEELEKRLPKKPIMTEDKQFALCYCCNGKGLLDKQVYCDNCGQKIDWSWEKVKDE